MSSRGGGGRFNPGDGDWTCPQSNCGNVNFARRTECNRCGTRKKESTDVKKGGTEIGKAMAEKSKGLFSADDWQCKTCGNVNWARRSTCNMCNSPKVGKIEQRTGYGGGFMERDPVVEYKRRSSDSEDEFDEFGRKKKKYRSVGGPSAREVREPEPPKKQVVQEEEDDDDDDDEDGDLSKYDLSGWGDSDDDGEDKTESPNNHKKSSSRSRSSRSSSSSYSRSRSRSRSRDRSKRSSRRSHSRSRSRSNSRRRSHGRRSRSRSPVRCRQRS
ncbi:hypothetical protein CAPTEDRAFT_166480 [Capitella teleta]|uniref:Zinc finger Ran-binding domain-containing protein 2 n=1 Tax=Capitella teleta TaxID=283909 RepID=R7T546_CAPTE|nr:hypothetical protein CAPTEDRAFT_166480 [Capitella teleta]|eukprot:ELT88317.1 hypothetical protein CAPTEDRAFT_166480 [Capitella teleta]